MADCVQVVIETNKNEKIKFPEVLGSYLLEISAVPL